MSRQIFCMLCKVSASIFATVLFAAMPMAHAQTEIEGATLEDLLNMKVVTASRQEEDSSMAPATIRVISQREIEDRGYKDLKDIFRDLPGFDLSQNLEGEVRTMAIARGILGENKLLVLLDGKRLNAITGERLVLGNNMPLFNIKRIEVMYGPGSVLYGADAYAGIVNMISKDYSDLKGGGSKGVLADISYGTQNTKDVGIAGAAKIADGIDEMLSVRYLNSDGIKPTNFKEFDTYSLGYSQPVTDYEIYSRTHIGQAMLTLYRQDAREPGGPGTNPDRFIFDKQYTWHQKQDKVSIDHSLKGDTWELLSTMSYEDYEIAPETNFQYTAGFGGPAYKYGRNMAISLEEKLDNKFTDKTSLSSGVLVERVDAFAKGNNLSSPYNRNDQVDTITYPNDPSIPANYRNKTLEFGTQPYSTVGVFSEAKHRFTDKLLMNLGGRYDYNSDYYGVFVPRLGAVYQATPSTVAKLLYSEAYIKPSRYEAFEHWSAQGAFGQYPNPSLKPEQLRTVQFDLQQRINSSFVVSANTYVNFIHNLITPSNYGAWNTNINNGSQKTQGGELLFDYQPVSNLRSFLYYTYLNAKQSNGAPMNKVADNKINAGLTYSLKQITLTPTVRYSDHVHFLDSTASQGVGKLNDFTIFDFSARWRGIFRGADAYLTVLNLFDRKYYTANPFGEGPAYWLEASAPQPGRTGELGLSYQF